VRAIFRVDRDIDPSLQHGVFKPGKESHAWIRFSNGNSERLSERWPDARGVAIKLLGVPGPKLLGDETSDTKIR
jgi:catalase